MNKARSSPAVSRVSCVFHRENDPHHWPFSYIFKQSTNSSYPAFCTQHLIERTLPIELTGAAGNIVAHPVQAERDNNNSLGFQIGDVAYLPNMKHCINPCPNP